MSSEVPGMVLKSLDPFLGFCVIILELEKAVRERIEVVKFIP